MNYIYQFLIVFIIVTAGNCLAQFPDIGRISLINSPYSSVNNLKIDNLNRNVISVDFTEFIESPLLSTSKLDSRGNTDAAIVVYAQNLTPIWHRHIYGVGDEYISGISIDAANSITVVGRFTSKVFIADQDDTLEFQNVGNTDIFIVKYDSNGEIQWAKTINGPINLIIESVTSNSQLGTTVVGSYSGITTFDSSIPYVLQGSDHYNGFLAYYDAIGEIQFVDTTSSAINSQEQLNSVVTDVSDNIITTGRFQKTSFISGGTKQDTMTSLGGYDIFLSKFSPNGQLNWTRTVRSKAGINEGKVLSVDAIDNIYLGGIYADSAIFNDGSYLKAIGEQNSFISKFSPLGNLIWSKSINSPSLSRISGVICFNNSVFVTGTFRNSLVIDGYPTTLISKGSNDIFLIEFDANGNCHNAINYGGGGLEISSSIGISQDSSWINVSGNLKGKSIFNKDTLPTLFYTTGAVVRLGGERLKPKELFISITPNTVQQIIRGDSVHFTVNVVDEKNQPITAIVTITDSLFINHRTTQFQVNNPNTQLSITTNSLKPKQLYTLSFRASKQEYLSSSIQQRFVILVDTLQNLLNLSIVPADTIVLGNTDSAIVSFIVTDSAGTLVPNALITIVDSVSSPIMVTARITGVNGAVTYNIRTTNKFLGLYTLRAIASKGGFSPSIERKRLFRVQQTPQTSQQFFIQFQTTSLLQVTNCDTITVNGVVKNANGIPQSGVTIQVVDSAAFPRKLNTITTNSLGEFSYSTIPNSQVSGLHRIRFTYSKVGFTSTQNFVSVQVISLIPNELFLKVTPIPIMETTIGSVVSYQCFVKNGICLNENGATVIIINSILNSSEQRITNSLGMATYQFIVPPTIQPGLYTLKFVASKNTFLGSDTLYRVVKINPSSSQLEPLIVKVSPSSTTISSQQCDSVILTAQVLDRLYIPVQGASVTMTTNAPVIPQFSTKISNQQGIVQFPFQISSINLNGLHRFDIIANKLGYDASNTETTFLRIKKPTKNEIFQVYPLDSIIALHEGESFNFTVKVLDSFCVGMANSIVQIRDSLKIPPMESFVEMNQVGTKVYSLFISEGFPSGIYTIEFESPQGEIIKKRIHIYIKNFEANKPQLVYPKNLSVGVSVKTPLVWAIFPGSIFYEWQVSEQSSVASTNDASFSIQSVGYPAALLLNKVYFWRVRAYGLNWVSDWSTIWSFSTYPINTSVFDIEINDVLIINPNPIHQNLHVTVSQYDENSKIEIYNSVGRLVVSLSKLSNSLEIPFNHFPNGVYSIRYSTLRGVISKQFIKLQ